MLLSNGNEITSHNRCPLIVGGLGIAIVSGMQAAHAGAAAIMEDEPTYHTKDLVSKTIFER